MSERQKLLDAAQSAVDLLTTVLLQQQESDHNDDKGDDVGHASVVSSEGAKVQGSIAPSGRNVDDDEGYTKEEMENRVLRSRVKCEHSAGRHDNTSLANTLPQRMPSQVAKVTPQRSVVSDGSRTDVTVDYSTVSGGVAEHRTKGFGQYLADFALERALTTSVLVLENAKLREELNEAKSDLTALNVEHALKLSRVPTKDVEVQTCARSLSLAYHQSFRGVREDLSSSDGEDNDFVNSNSSSPELRQPPRASYRRQQRGERHLSPTHRYSSSNLYFCSPASTFSAPDTTPGTLGRASTVSSSGGGLARKKLPLPKSLTKTGYLSITSNEDSSEGHSSTSSIASGCCPFFCFKCPFERKSKSTR